MSDDLKHYEYINDLCNIDFKDDKLLQLFSIYISSNRDFKYNATYLIDSITKFKNNIDIFQSKKETAINFSENLSKQYIAPCDWIIILDDVFIIDNYFKFNTLITFAKNYNTYIGKNISQISEEIVKYHLKQFNLFLLNPKKVNVAYYNLEDKRNYSFMDEFINDLKLSKLVEADYIKLGTKEE